MKLIIIPSFFIISMVTGCSTFSSPATPSETTTTNVVTNVAKVVASENPVSPYLITTCVGGLLILASAAIVVFGMRKEALFVGGGGALLLLWAQFMSNSFTILTMEITFAIACLMLLIAGGISVFRFINKKKETQEDEQMLHLLFDAIPLGDAKDKVLSKLCPEWRSWLETKTEEQAK